MARSMMPTSISRYLKICLIKNFFMMISTHTEVYDVGANDLTTGYLWIFYAIFGSLSVIPVATCFTLSVFILCIKRREEKFIEKFRVDEEIQTDFPGRRLRFSRNEEDAEEYTRAPMPRLKRYSELSNIVTPKNGELGRTDATELSTINEESGSTDLTMLSETIPEPERDTIADISILRREIKPVKRSLPLLFPEEEVANPPAPKEESVPNGEVLEPRPPKNRSSETIRHITIAHPSRQEAVEVARKVASFGVPTVSKV
uniref:Uncharacterized protein n=1 Tax=Schistocephalus solidus TaxID=70667 RepID=A0A0X3Q6T1_SCHSO